MEFRNREEEYKEKSSFKWVKLLIFLSILLIVVAAIIVTNVNEAKKRKSEKSPLDTMKLVGNDLYSMEYSGDYFLDEFLEAGGAKTDGEWIRFVEEKLYNNKYKIDVTTEGFGCSTLSVVDENGAALFGRNYDANPCKGMVVITRPDNGYASISTCALNFIGIDDEWEPDSYDNKMKALASLYIPVDGMNEKGLCVAVLMISDGTVTDQNTDKKDITTTTAVRLLLDKATNVDEAIALLKEYDMHSSIGRQFKFALSDANGKSALVEYINNEMNVVDAVAASNFYQTPGEYYGIGLDGECPRYGRLMSNYKKTNGVMNETTLLEVMEYSSQKYFFHGVTQWTAVFNTKELKATYCSGHKYSEKYYFELSE